MCGCVCEGIWIGRTMLVKRPPWAEANKTHLKRKNYGPMLTQCRCRHFTGNICGNSVFMCSVFLPCLPFSPPLSPSTTVGPQIRIFVENELCVGIIMKRDVNRFKIKYCALFAFTMGRSDWRLLRLKRSLQLKKLNFINFIDTHENVAKHHLDQKLNFLTII